MTNGKYHPMIHSSVYSDDDKQIEYYYIQDWALSESFGLTDFVKDNQISNYYVIQNDQKFYIPTYNVDGQTCFKVKFTPQEPFGEYVRAQDVWLLNGSQVHSN